MSNVGPEGRSYAKIEREDLKRLRAIAKKDLNQFFRKNSVYARLYSDRVLCIALCQGAAQHYVDGKTGVHDFDVWTFFRRNPEKPWCYRRNVPYDFGDSKFGKSADRPGFIGRGVDCLGRDIEVLPTDNAESALKRYLKEGKSTTAKLLAKKAVVLLEPDLGKVIWPVKG